MLKKIFASLCIAIVCLFSVFPTPALAQKWWEPSFQEFRAKVDQGDTNDIFGERYTYAQVNWVIWSLVSFMVGNIGRCATTVGNPVEFATCLLTEGPASTFLAIGTVTDSMISNKPASGVRWVSETASKIHLIPEANAQGAGFQSLEIAQKLWTASRNTAYALMTLAIIILSFMIMFRFKLNPQTAISIQTAIPRVAIGLVLITFSYAIAGFIIDLAYVVQGVFALMFSSQVSGISSLNPVELFGALNNGFHGMMSLGIGFLFVALIPATILGLVAGAAGGPFAAVSIPVGLAVSLGFVTILIIGTFLFATVRVFWVLLKTYVTVILTVVVLPFYILAGVVVPQIGFTSWLRSFVANIAIFPAVSILLLLAHTFFYGMFSLPFGAQTQYWFAVNPFGINPGQFQAVNATLPTFGGGAFSSSTFLGFAIGMVIVLSIPSIANSIKSFIATGKAAPAQMGLGAISALAGFAGGVGITAARQGMTGAAQGWLAARMPGLFTAPRQQQTSSPQATQRTAGAPPPQGQIRRP